MDKRGARPVVSAWAGGAALFAAVVYLSEGPSGFRPFLNLEALGLVLLGTAASLTVSYPASQVVDCFRRAFGGVQPDDEEDARRRAGLLSHAADSALGMGAAATLLGLILLLSSVEDVCAVPRRMALSLTALLYGVVLSEAVFMPLARRVRRECIQLTLPVPGAPRRFLVGLGAGGSALLGLMAVLYAMSAPLH